MESGGTVLSTNWDEISKKKTECKPPEVNRCSIVFQTLILSISFFREWNGNHIVVKICIILNFHELRFGLNDARIDFCDFRRICFRLHRRDKEF